MAKNYATYKKVFSGCMVSNGEVFGTIDTAAFDMVLVNWQGINPVPLPPLYYPKDVWDFRFGGNFEIVDGA